LACRNVEYILIDQERRRVEIVDHKQQAKS
jgi:hypothetical protein